MAMLDRRTALRSLLAACLAPGMTGWALRSATAQNPASNAGRRVIAINPRREPIRMGIQIFTGAVATVWAERKIYQGQGFFTVDAKQMADGRSVRDAMVAGQLDVGTMNITPFIVGAAASGLTMVGVVSLGGDTVGVVARKGAGIDGVAALRGRRVGISVGSTTGNIFVRTVAPQAGLQPGDYQVVNMRPADQVAALAAGSVDAITSFEPYMTVAETEGIGVTLMRFGAIDPNPTCLVLTPVWSRACQHRELVPQIVARRRGLLAQPHRRGRRRTGPAVELGRLRQRHQDVAEEMVRQIKVEPDITPALADHIRREAEQMKAANLIRTLPDWDKVLRPDLLAAARAG